MLQAYKLPGDNKIRLISMLSRKGFDNLIVRQIRDDVLELHYKTHYIISMAETIELLDLLKEFEVDTNLSYFSASLISLKFKQCL